MAHGQERKDETLNLSERLNLIDGFDVLTPLQKNICLEHANHPDLDKESMAIKLGVKKSLVYEFFHSRVWQKINSELLRQEISELAQLSIFTLRSLLKHGKDSIRSDIAMRILEAEGAVPSKFGPQKIMNADSKMLVIWGKDKEKAPVNISDFSINGNKNTLQPALETERNSRE